MHCEERQNRKMKKTKKPLLVVLGIIKASSFTGIAWDGWRNVDAISSKNHLELA
jgi:hypothetical protein